jgi:threonine dehydratase
MRLRPPCSTNEPRKRNATARFAAERRTVSVGFPTESAQACRDARLPVGIIGRLGSAGTQRESSGEPTCDAAPVSVSAVPDSRAAQELVARHARRTPLLTSRLLSEETGFDVRLKAELFQRTGSYKIRGPLVKLARLSEEERARGVVCSSAGNHAQGVALAAALLGVRAVVVMAKNATPSKVEATRGYGAEVVLHGTIWDEADAKARELVESRGLTYVHPFDDVDLISGQGTVGIEVLEDWPEVELIVVPIGGGGLISGIATAVKRERPDVRIVGVESADGPAMKTSVERGELVTLDRVDTIVDGLRVKRVGETTFQLVRRFVDEIVAVPDEWIFENVLWTMAHTKLVAEGAAAATVAALRGGQVEAPPGTNVVCILSGGNLDLAQLRGLRWN